MIRFSENTAFYNFNSSSTSLAYGFPLINPSCFYNVFDFIHLFIAVLFFPRLLSKNVRLENKFGFISLVAFPDSMGRGE